MIIAVPPGNNVRIHGKSQGYLGLPVAHETYSDGTPAMRTCWTPTPEELEKLNKGGNVLIELLGSIPPPMKVDVTNPPE